MLDWGGQSLLLERGTYLGVFIRNTSFSYSSRQAVHSILFNSFETGKYRADEPRRLIEPRKWRVFYKQKHPRNSERRDNLRRKRKLRRRIKQSQQCHRRELEKTDAFELSPPSLDQIANNTNTTQRSVVSLSRKELLFLSLSISKFQMRKARYVLNTLGVPLSPSRWSPFNIFHISFYLINNLPAIKIFYYFIQFCITFHNHA